MTTNSWKRELKRLLKMFEVESTVSLGKIKDCFEALGRPFDEQFREYLLKKSTKRLNKGFDTVLFGGNNGTTKQKASHLIPSRQAEQLASTANHSKQIKVEPNASADEQHTPIETDESIDHLIEGFVEREFNSIKTEIERDLNNVDDDSGRNLNKVKVTKPFENLWDSLLSQIESKENEAKRFGCNDCNYAAKYKYNLTRHKEIHIFQKENNIHRNPNDGFFKCVDCDLKFLKWHAFKLHFTVSHRNSRPSFSCFHCLRRFTEEIKKDRHESRCQSPRYECHLCKKYVTHFKRNLREHMRIHSGTKPLQCHVCNMSFRQVPTLRKHVARAHKYAHMHDDE